MEAAGSIDEAIAEYQQVLLIDPRFFQALNNLGSLLSSCGRYGEATAHLRLAIECCPNSAEFHYNLANTLSRAGNCEEAVNEYRESIRLNPNIAETYNNLATALHTLGRHDEALTELSKSLALRARLRRGACQPDDDRTIEGRPPSGNRRRDRRRLSSLCFPSMPRPSSGATKAGIFKTKTSSKMQPPASRRALELDPNCAGAYFGLGLRTPGGQRSMKRRGSITSRDC